MKYWQKTFGFPRYCEISEIPKYFGSFVYIYFRPHYEWLFGTQAINGKQPLDTQYSRPRTLTHTHTNTLTFSQLPYYK